MKKIYLIGLSLVTVGLISGCGSSDSDSSLGGVTTKAAEITTVEAAKEAAAAFTQINSMGSMGSGFANAGRAPKRVASLASIPKQTQNCSSGGTMTTSGSYSSDGTNMDMTQSYNNCNQYGTKMDGSTRIVQNTNGNNIDMKMTMKNFKFTNSAGYYEMDFTMEIDTNQNYNPMDMLLNGKINLNASGYYYNAGYDNFRIKTDDNYINISGTVSLESDINSCYNGTYDVETLDDLYLSGAGYSSGSMKINGAIYTYSGNDVSITLANGDTSVVSQSSLSAGCN